MRRRHFEHRAQVPARQLQVSRALSILTRSNVNAPSQEGAFFFRRSEALAALVLASASVVIFQIYSAAFSFGSSFDDAWNLAGLERISDWESAGAFVFGGVAGPTGRPLALLTFLPQLWSWPSAPEDLLYQNALIHLLNIQLVAWIVLRLSQATVWPIRSPCWFAVSVALVWGCSPLLFSTTAMIIQRMTSLSAMFCFLGLLGYLYGREQLASRRRIALLIMSASIASGTLLATLCKENGALLPGFVLIVEAVLLHPMTGSASATANYRSHRTLLGLLCAVPSLLILSYLIISNVPNAEAKFLTREFSLEQRLLTESRILLKYLSLLFFPVRSELTPFNDDFVLSNSLFEPKAQAAVSLWFLCLFLAWRWRFNQFRMFSFAVFWFLWGHVTESTVVPLELYFEHRNYLPALGPVLAVVALLFHPAVAQKWRVAVIGLMISTSTFVLRETALLWSDSRVAAETWYAKHPNSLRSLQFLLISLSSQRRYDEYLRVVDSVGPPLRDGSEFALIRLVAYCGLKDPEDVQIAASNAKARLATQSFRSSVTDLLDKLADGVPLGECPGLSIEDVKELLGAALTNPNPKIRSDIRAQAHEILARLILPERDLNATMYHLEEAYRLRPTTSVGIAMSNILASAGLYDQAQKKLDDLRRLKPGRPFVRRQWQNSISEMQDIISKGRPG